MNRNSGDKSNCKRQQMNLFYRISHGDQNMKQVQRIFFVTLILFMLKCQNISCSTLELDDELFNSVVSSGKVFHNQILHCDQTALIDSKHSFTKVRKS